MTAGRRQQRLAGCGKAERAPLRAAGRALRAVGGRAPAAAGGRRRPLRERMLTHVGTAAEQEAEAARIERMGAMQGGAGGASPGRLMENLTLSQSAMYVGLHTQPREAVQVATECLLRDPAAAREVAIPIGAVVSPCLQPVENGVPEPLQCIRRAAARCSGCGSFLNQFCDPKQNASGVEWTCVFCRAKNVAKQVESTLSPELQSHTVEYRSPH